MNKPFCAFIIALVCMLCSLNAYTQSLREKHNQIERSGMNNTQKIDSLFLFYLTNYHKDYALVDSMATATLHLSKKIGYVRGEGIMQMILASVQESLGNLARSEQYAKSALNIFIKHKLEKDLPRAYYTIGTYYRRKNRNADAMNAILQGLKIAEKIKDSVGIRLAYTSFAILNVTEKNYDKALEYHRKALEVSKRINDRKGEQKCYTNIGIVHSRKKDYAQALKFHQQALNLAIELKEPQTIAFVYNDLGSTYLYLANYQRSIDFLKKSISIREDGKEFSELSYTYCYLGQAYSKNHNFVLAEKALKKAYAIAHQIGNNKQMYEAFEELSNLYAYYKKYDSAFVYSHRYNLFRDSIRQIENSENLNQLSTQYETEKKEQQIKELSQQNTIQELELEQRKFLLLISVILIVFALLVAYLIYYKRKQREKRLELEAQLLKVEAEQKITSERVRISRDLHDNIGSYLTFINSSMGAVESENAEQQSKLDQIKGLTLETIKELRKTVWLINKNDVTVEEFSVKLRELFKNISYLKINTKGTLKSKITAPQATEVFRVVQESVNNAVKHSDAAEIIIEIENTDEKVLFVSVADNGKGFDLGRRWGGHGLSNMRARIEALKGAFDIHSVPGEGTYVKIALPLETLK